MSDSESSEAELDSTTAAPALVADTGSVEIHNAADSELTQAGPTQLAPAESGPLAYEDATDVFDDYPPFASHWRVSLVVTAILAVSGLVIGALIFVGKSHRPTEAGSTTAATTSTTPALPPGLLLNGKYEISYDWPNVTYRGNERRGGGKVHWDHSRMPDKTWMAFSTTCTQTDCIATTVEVTAENMPLPDVHGVMRLENGMWIDLAPWRRQQSSTSVKTGETVCTSWWTSRWSFAPRPDGTFHGDYVTSVDSDECEDKGNTQVVPVVVTRVGDTPPGVTFGAPAAAPTPLPPVTKKTTTPVAPAPKLTIGEYDNIFINKMAAKNWTIVDATVMANEAHYACQLLMNGQTPVQVAQLYSGQSGNSLGNSLDFVNTAMSIYPNCP